MTKDEIERRRAEAMAAGGSGKAGQRQGGGQAPSSPGLPSQSRLTLARAAIRPAMKGRVMLSGPPGAGKTYTGLVIATILVGPTGRILVIDSEKESSLTYADVFDFEQLPWNPPFDPTALSLTLKEAAEHYDAIIIDSFSHFWRKQGGVLDIAGDNVRGWKAARPIQENLIETILDVDAHVIVCCRSKMDHLIEQKDGKTVVTKAGIKAQQDDDLEYEVNVALEIDMPHVLHIVKSRTNAVPVGAQFIAGLAGDFAQQYREWLAAGEPVAPKGQTDELREALRMIPDEGRRLRAMGGFLDEFGRPEFLLVSRLPEAQQWVADAVAGTLPVDRGEDDTPPEDDGTDAPGSAGGPSAPEGHNAPAAAQRATEAPAPAPSSSSPDTGDQTGQSGTAESTAQRQHGRCADCGAPITTAGSGWYHDDQAATDACPNIDGVEPAADEECPHLSATGVDQAPVGPAKVWRCDGCGRRYRERPVDDGTEVVWLDGPDQAQQWVADRQGPAVFNGDTGMCDQCGAPIWYSVEDEAWLHADEGDDEIGHERGPAPAAAGVDVDALYAATHPAGQDLSAMLRSTVEAEVAAMTLAAIARELGARGAVSSGKPQQLRARLVDVIVAERAGDTAAATT